MIFTLKAVNHLSHLQIHDKLNESGIHYATESGTCRCLKLVRSNHTHTHTHKELPAFVQPESAQDTITGPFPEPVESNTHPNSLILVQLIQYYPAICTWFWKWSLPFIPYCRFICTARIFYACSSSRPSWSFLILLSFFSCGERPRNRSLKAYCATLWWRWRFFCFASNGAPVEWNRQWKTEVLGENPVPVPICPPQIPHGLTGDRTRASEVRVRRLTFWAMARPLLLS
jgi:hypothetical protein